MTPARSGGATYPNRSVSAQRAPEARERHLPAPRPVRDTSRPTEAQPGREPARDVATAGEPTAYVEHWGLPLIVVVIGMFMSVLDTSIVNVAIPVMQDTYGASADSIQWVATAYNLCLGVVVPTSAWLGNRVGLRKLYIVSLVGFAVLSGLCGTADNLNLMIVYRILQAVPGGVIPVTCLTLLTRMVPPKQLGTAMGLYGFGMVVAPGVGPALGGYLVEYIDWRLIFFINVPIGLLGAIAALFVLPRISGAKGQKFDTLGFACIATGLFAILLAVSEGQQWGWTSYPIVILGALSIDMLALFVIVELHVAQPLLDVRVFARWPFVSSMILVGILSTGFFATLYYIPLFLQNGQKITPMNTGLAVLPQAVVMMLIMPLAGRAYDRFGARWPAVTGMLLAGVGVGMMAGFSTDMSRTQVVIWTCIQAAGLALAFMPIMTAGLAALPESISEAGNAYTNLVQRVSGALAIAVFTALTTAWQIQDMADRSSLLKGSGADANPQALAMKQQGPGGLLQLWQQLQTTTEAQSYSNAFLLLGIATILCAFSAVLLHHGRPDPASRPHVEIG